MNLDYNIILIIIIILIFLIFFFNFDFLGILISFNLDLFNGFVIK